MAFDNDKKTALSKEDKSSKGSIDEHISDLCLAINALPDYYTTSSCSGRTMLIKIPESGRKNETEWVFVSHDLVLPSTVIAAISSVPEEQVWFRFESFILHIAARDIEAASKLLKVLQGSGFKRSGIIALGDKIIIESVGTDHIDAVVSKGKVMLIDEKYFSVLVDAANKKMERNFESIAKLVAAVKGL